MNLSDIINSILAILSFILALISIITVIITIKQNEKLLQANKKQLEEMQEEHRLSAQPIITLANGHFFVEKPNLFYTPSRDEYNFSSKYCYRVFLKNVTSSTAICIDASAKLIFPEKEIDSKEVSVRRNILYNNTKSRPASFYFVEDENFDLYQALRGNKTRYLPRLEINIVYKNTCGGYFQCKQKFVLAPTARDLDTIRNWHTAIVSASVESKEAIEAMKGIQNKEKWMEIFQEERHNFNSRLGAPNLSKLELEVIELPEKYDFRVLSQNEYDQIVKKHHYLNFIHDINRNIRIEEAP